MASTNLDAPMGFRALENGVAGVVPRLRKYTVAASTAIYEGDIVALNASGLVIAYTTTDAIGGDLIGVAAHHVPSGGAGPSSDLGIHVYDDPEQIFEVQANDDSLTVHVDYAFKMFGVVKTTGNTTTLQSKHELNDATGGAIFGTNTTTVRPIQVIAKSTNPTNTVSATASWAKFNVKIHQNAHLRGGGGISYIGGGIS